MSKGEAKPLEGFICPQCVVDFPSAVKLQNHWLSFHSVKQKPYRTCQSSDNRDSEDYEEILEIPGGATAKVNVSNTTNFGRTIMLKACLCSK